MLMQILLLIIKGSCHLLLLIVVLVKLTVSDMLANLLSIYLAKILRVCMLLRRRNEDIFRLINSVLLTLVVWESLIEGGWLRISARWLLWHTHSSTHW